MDDEIVDIHRHAVDADRVEALQLAFRRNDMAYEVVSAGAYFAYLKHPFGDTPSAQVARLLADDHNVLCNELFHSCAY